MTVVAFVAVSNNLYIGKKNIEKKGLFSVIYAINLCIYIKVLKKCYKCYKALFQIFQINYV